MENNLVSWRKISFFNVDKLRMILYKYNDNRVIPGVIKDSQQQIQRLVQDKRFLKAVINVQGGHTR